MSKVTLAISGIALDDLGRTILSDEILEHIENFVDTSSAGANLSCTGTTNGSCTNGFCGGSANTSCTNQTSCMGATNQLGCKGYDDRQPN
jgi:hypothetical protein